MSNIIFHIFLLVNIYTISPKTCFFFADSLKEKALKELKEVLNIQPQWIKVHAGEYLISLGYSKDVEKKFLYENRLYSSESKYRIGIWRVLAQAEKKEGKRNRWINKIYKAFTDTSATDRVHAIETLAKLRISPFEKFPGSSQNLSTSGNRNLNTYLLWATSYSSDSALKKTRQVFLEQAVYDSSEAIRRISALALRKMRGFTIVQWNFLAKNALSEPVQSTFRNTLLNTAYVTFTDDATQGSIFQNVKEEMLKCYMSFSFEKRYELALALAEKGTVTELPILQFLLNNENIFELNMINSKEAADVRAAAAFAILKIKGYNNPKY